MGKQFDERYPAMFQPGGDELPRTLETVPQAEQILAIVPAAPEVPATPEVLEVPKASEVQKDQTQPRSPTRLLTRRHMLSWFVPLVCALVMIALAIFALTVQYWFPASMVAKQADYLGIVPETWGQIIIRAAPAPLVVGFGTVAALVFLPSRRRAETERAARNAFGLLALFIGAAGFFALYAFKMFPEQSNYNAAMYDGSLRYMPWPYVIMPCGMWLLALALLMLAVLIIVPRLWQEDFSDESNFGPPPVSRKPSIQRGLCFGIATTAAGIMTLFAYVIFPPERKLTPAVNDSYTTDSTSWLELIQYMSPTLLLVGLSALAWAAVYSALLNHSHGAAVSLEQESSAAVEH